MTRWQGKVYDVVTGQYRCRQARFNIHECFSLVSKDGTVETLRTAEREHGALDTERGQHSLTKHIDLLS